jgi:hypothetical protein
LGRPSTNQVAQPALTRVPLAGLPLGCAAACAGAPEFLWLLWLLRFLRFLRFLPSFRKGTALRLGTRAGPASTMPRLTGF